MKIDLPAYVGILLDKRRWLRFGVSLVVIGLAFAIMQGYWFIAGHSTRAYTNLYTAYEKATQQALSEGDTDIQQGDWQEAVDAYQQALSHEPIDKDVKKGLLLASLNLYYQSL